MAAQSIEELFNIAMNVAKNPNATPKMINTALDNYLNGAYQGYRNGSYTNPDTELIKIFNLMDHIDNLENTNVSNLANERKILNQQLKEANLGQDFNNSIKRYFKNHFKTPTSPSLNTNVQQPDVVNNSTNILPPQNNATLTDIAQIKQPTIQSPKSTIGVKTQVNTDDVKTSGLDNWFQSNYKGGYTLDPSKTYDATGYKIPRQYSVKEGDVVNTYNVDLADLKSPKHVNIKNNPLSYATTDLSTDPTNYENFKMPLANIGTGKNQMMSVQTDGNGTGGKGLKGLFNNIKSKWNKDTGFTGKLSPYINTGLGIMQGAQAIGGLSNIGQNVSNIDDLKAQILNSYSSNPYANSMLTSDQLNAVRRLKRGYKSADKPGINDVLAGIGSNLPSILLNTGLGLATGNVGAIVNGVGSAINSGIQGYNNAQSQQLSELENLYGSLVNAEQQYRSRINPLNYFPRGY